MKNTMVLRLLCFRTVSSKNNNNFTMWFQCVPVSFYGILAYVAGVKGEWEGEQERGRRGTGARDEGTPATKTPIFSFLQLPAAAKF